MSRQETPQEIQGDRSVIEYLMSLPEWTDVDFREVRSDEYPMSASAIKSYKRCEEKFRLKYEEGHRPSGSDNKYLKLGSAVHESIETILQKDTATDLVTMPNQLRSTLLDEYRERDPDLEDDMYDAGVGCMTVAARYIAANGSDGIRDIEKEFQTAVAETDIAFQGKMDVTTHSEIWDWKTGKNVYEEDEVIQGMIYAFGYYAAYGEVPDKINFVYLRNDGDNDPKQRSFEPDDEKYQTMINWVYQVIESKNTGQYEATPGPTKCHFCDLSPWCGYDPSGAGDIEMELF